MAVKTAPQQNTPTDAELKSALFMGAIQEDDPSGTYKGHIGTSGELDDVGDIILAGGFKRTVKENFDKLFFAVDHTWSLANEIGVVTHAEEDAKGLYIEGVFHDTQDAQDARKKMLKRLKLGKPVKTSIGYSPSKKPFYLYPNQYDRELPKYLKPECLQAGLAKASRFDKIRILPEVEVFEGSGVQIPANPSAELTSVKSLEGADVTSVRTDNSAMITEKKDYFTSAYAETQLQQGLWPLMDALREALDELQEDCEKGECPEADAELRSILNSFASAIYVLVFPTLNTDASKTMSTEKCAALDSHLSILLQLKQGLIGNLQNGTHFATVQAAVDECLQYVDVLSQEIKTHTQREREIIQRRQEEKAGRTISNATHGRMMGHCEKIDAMVEHLQNMKADLVSLASTGRGDEDTAKAAEATSEEKGQSGENKPDNAPQEEVATPETKSTDSEAVTATESDVASTEEKSAIEDAPSNQPEDVDASAKSVDQLRKEREAKLKLLGQRIRLL